MKRAAIASRKPSVVPLAVAITLAAAGIICTAWLWSMFSAAHPSATGSQDIISGFISEPVYSDGFPDVDWEYWRSVNADIIGWVTVPGTAIDYPIVQASEDSPDYYLTHDVYGGYNVYGVPYLDAECSEGGLLHSKNAIMYGHHMDDGSMFAAFADYAHEDYALEHTEILVQTPTEKKRLQVRCVERVNGASGKRTEFLDSSDFAAWYQEQLDKAIVVLDGSPVASLMTFCTCSYSSYNERTLVLAAQNDGSGL